MPRRAHHPPHPSRALASIRRLKNLCEAFAQLKRPNPVVEVVFKDFSKGKYKVLSFYAKRARGLMANYIVQHKVNDWEELKDFNLDGYYYHPESSSQKQLVFLRDHI